MFGFDMKISYSSFCLFTILSLAAAAQNVALITESDEPPPVRHGVAVLQYALRAKGMNVTDQIDGADYVLLVGGKSAQNAARAIHQDAALPQAAESLAIFRGRVKNKPTVVLLGGDARGLMYAALDTAERIAASPAANPFEQVHETTETPYLAVRGISTYTMQRAYFEQRLYDQRYWTRYFDMLAASRINSFVVIFGYENGGFMAPLYPFFFNTPGFPGVELVGITPQQQEKNTRAFQALLRIAHERGIEITAGIWDHIYRGGVQGGGIPGAADDAGKRVPGLVFGVTADNLAAYTKASLHRLLEVFPDLDAIQFRMHDESGLKHEEMQPFWHDVFSAIKQDHPNLKLDLRAKELPDAVLNDAVNMGLNSQISTKYWMEQIGLPFHPTHINVENQKDRRHGYADLLHYPRTYRVHWQLWSGGSTRLLLWGDPEYVRRFAASVKIYDGRSFEVNEMLATKMLGEPQDETPLEILTPKYRFYDYEFERYWHFYRVWGRVSYNPETDPAVWSREFDTRFGSEAGGYIMRGLHLASEVVPRIVASSYLYKNFPTTRGWAEMNRQGSLPQYAGEEGSDIQQFMNVRDEAKSILAGTDTPMRRPEENSRWFAKRAEDIEAYVEDAQKTIGSHSSKEFQSTVADLRILAALARYHSWRLMAGVEYNLYKQTESLAAFDEAIAAEQHALEAWQQMVKAAGDVYSENLAFGAHAVGFSRHWKEEYSLLSRDFEQLKVERTKATGKAAEAHYKLDTGLGAPPPVRILPNDLANPNSDFIVAAHVDNQPGLKSIRLRYRHVTQFEDYQTAEMALDAKSGNYLGRIPASFIDTKWDLMYFIEAIGKNGAGRMYPDLEVEQPYVIVSVKRPTTSSIPASR
jgi:hypothetical protein